ncbi:hypothetical protein GGR57DRAFT_440115 [Xylariaceae sp. FL1272]|nr:hypothetical protein GGR57DRAFT_440115 [Xylariaceae sp. FL1272]
MAFSASNVARGPPLPDLQTEALGFLSLAGDARLRLTAPWSPAPSPHASLMSIASRRRLVAAAAPDALLLADTHTVRKAFDGPKDADTQFLPFSPRFALPLPVRLCQLAFSADEAYLVLSAEQGGGLAVCEVDAVLGGNISPTFEMSTNGEPLRALVPNHQPEKAEFCAVVTVEGKLFMADLQKRDLVGGALKDNVSCVAWSSKGKQIVAGLSDGTMVQMTPEGQIKAEIPRPPDLDATHHVSAIMWLENDLFLAFHVSIPTGPSTKCHLITRKEGKFQYQSLLDPVDPYNNEKVPHHNAVRLKDFSPHLQDLLIFSSTAVPDIGLLARSTEPLAPNAPTGVFANVELADDTRRATLPMGEDLDTPAAIGVSLDLSSQDPVYRPIPGDELNQSPGPLPGYWVLNDQGILSVWWIVYTDSIRGGTTYSGFAAVEASSAVSATKPAAQTAPSNPFAAQSAPSNPFATATATMGGSNPPGPAFGGPSALGTNRSPWGASSTSGSSTFGSSTLRSSNATAANSVFGQPSLGTSSALTSTFGQSSGLGAASSPWGSAATTRQPPSAQSGFAQASTTAPNPFGIATSNASPANPFGTFANERGFAALEPKAGEGGPSIFASKKFDSPFSTTTPNPTSSFPPSSEPAGNIGVGSSFGNFKLKSSFTASPDVGNEDDQCAAKDEKTMFGSGFTSSLGQTTNSPSTLSRGEKPGLFGQPKASTTNVESTTPTTTPAANKFFSQPSSTSENKGLFGFPAKSSGDLFGTTTLKAPEPQATSAEDTPLPPESTSKAAYPLGESSSSSATTESVFQAEDVISPSVSSKSKATAGAEKPADEKSKETSGASAAPLPPDPTRNKKLYSAPLPPLPEATATPKAGESAALPPDPVTNKRAYASPLPSLPGVGAQAKPKSTGVIPLPPDPVKQPKAYENKLPALPIAKAPSAVAGPGFKFPTDLPPVSDSDDDEDDEHEETEAVSEGSGIDVARDLSPQSTGANRTPGFTPQSSDGLGGSFSTVSRPEPERRSLFGELGRTAPMFPQPNPVSPRSPSPVRGAVPSRVLGQDQQRSFSAPGMASQILGASREPVQARLGASIIGRETAYEDAVLEQRKAKAKKAAEEQAQALIDEEDDAIQQLLQTEIQPTLYLDEFIAHSGVAPPASESVPAQVEAVYRDINSMIDTLGLNARSLMAFIQGHETLSSEQRTKQDLGTPDVWTLSDTGHLTYLIDNVLGQALAEARVIDVEAKVMQLKDLVRDFTRDCNKQVELNKTMAARLDPEEASSHQSLPLNPEQIAQQSDLRRQLGQFQTLLAQSEEALTLLKAKLVSATSGNGKAGPVPTVEAIVRTITKMTSMVEKRSGDIDVLENKMRKLRLGSTDPTASRDGSPFATPKRIQGTSILSPDRSVRESTPLRSSNIHHSLSGSISLGDSAFRTPPRKKLSGFGDAERKAVKDKRARRSVLLGTLRDSIQKKGPVVWAIDDVE